ncbi:hypothetical protein [Halocatena marina]|uniref:hypothetical protein n=1 Tax=Halocatena marina TaxID=2934937 RepID=UPI00200DF8D0|nr:hypothetical protein [Halocatena marina]
MKEKPREYGKLAVIVVVMIVVYIYTVHPFLLDVAPFLTFQPSDGFERRSGGFGPFSLAATVLIGIFFYYIVIEYTVDAGILSLFAAILLTVLVLIPNRFLPEKYHPGTITQRDIRERLSRLIPRI